MLARAGLPALHDVVLRDSLGLTQVDHLVRLLDRIVVLETKAYAGMVTGGMGDRHWVQHLRAGQVRTAFLNPLLRNLRHVRAVRELADGGTAVDALVVSAGSARFCGDLEAAVVKLDELAVRLCAMRPLAGSCSPAPRVDAAWRALTTAVSRSMELRAAHEEQVRHRPSGGW